MRTGILTAAVITALGLAGVPSMVQAHEDEHRGDGHTQVREVRETRPTEVRRVEHVDRVVRDVRVERPVVVERDVRHWDHDRVYVPTPVVTVGVPCVTSVPCAPAPVVGFFDTPIGIEQIPPVVLNNAGAQSGGAPIVSADYVHNAVGTYYDVHIAGPYNTIRTMRFGLNGGFYGFL